MEANGLKELPQYVKDAAASALDDEQVEWVVNHLPDEELLGLQAYAAAWDEESREGHEEAITRYTLVRPPLPWRFLLPVALLSIAIIIWAGGI